ncbi:Ribosomal RNA adenine dimethylase [Polystyrenella longa]|uniref:Ribosomal RNA small subunit methyltransferase A n=1 Tax=Polystyrenella longa TaxID=2528007 RepID=A0A518CUE3_9PLAN|nr:16S rRNA (adenine(1518)-N(6)/adenine(1519)-N(6))-dimethyltransferase RsmA [Polystyrenella longa]QDU82828.1 Ribosomal RNA adenine dimethylase [Polystyrenella longa]
MTSPAERQTRSYLMELFERRGFSPRHFLGQNFLIDVNLVDYVVEKADLTPEDLVLEVGSGTGGMTTFLSEEAGHVISVEIDPNMFELASEVTATRDNVTLLNTDALRNKNNFSKTVTDVIDAKLAENPGYRLKLVANLPYSIATPLISNMVASDYDWKRMVVTIQLELGLRMEAGPGSSNYGALSVWLQSQCNVKVIKKVSPKVFWPRPKVFSAIVRLEPAPTKAKKIKNRPFFQDFVRRLFHQRRKLMRSVLAGMYRKELNKNDVDLMMGQLELDPKTRAEELPVEVLVQLCNRVYAAVMATRSL